jgi:hypothetical protein
MADVTREEFDALKARVDKLDPPAQNEPTVVIVTKPGPEYVDVSWSLINTTQVPISWWVGRDGLDKNGSGPWEVSEPSQVVSRRFDKLVAGTNYKFHVEAVFVGSPSRSTQVSAVALPASTAPPATPVPPGPVTPGKSILRPTGRRSGLKVNVSLFKGGATNLSNMDSNPLGIKFDGGLSFNTRGQGWDPKKDDGLIADIIAVQKAGGFFVVTMPHSMDGDANMNTRGANNDYIVPQRAMAAYWKAKGVNPDQLIIRLDWEFNGGWYPWTAAAPGGTTALKGACKNFMDNWRAGGMTGTLFDLCANMPSSASSASWRDLWLGAGYWDIFSIDQYDAYPGVTDHSKWESKMVPVQSVRRCAQEAKSFGAMWGIAECGNWHNSDGAYDNPIYWQEMSVEVKTYSDHMAYWNIYDDQGAPANLFHDWAHNPKSAAALKGIFNGWKL